MADKNANSRKQEESQPVVLSKDEMNLAEFPFTLLSRRARSDQKTIEVSQQIKDQEGRIIKQEWIVTGSDKYGLPLAIDEDIYIALMQLYKEDDFRSRSVHFSRYEMLRIMGKETSKRGYDRVEEAFNRLVSVTIVSKNAFWDNKARMYVSRAFHLFDSYSLYDERLTGREQEQQSLPLSNIVMSELLFDSIGSGYIKNLDTKLYFSLDTPLSKRLYRYLDKKRYQKTRFEIGLLKLAALLPIQDQYPSQVKRRLDRSHNELVEKGFLKSATYKETKDNDGEKVIYIFPRASSSRQKQKYISGGVDVSDQPEISEEKIFLRQQLIERGITETVATGLVEKYTAEQIEKQIEVFDCLLKADSPLLEKNPPGFLRKAIEDDYTPPQEYARQAARQEKREAEETRIAEAERKRQAVIEEELANWDRVPSAERVKGFVDFWIEGEKIKKGSLPTSEEIEAKIKEQVNDLPQTEEERRQYLAREHTLEKYF